MRDPHEPQPDSPEPPTTPPVELPEPPITEPPRSPRPPPPVTARRAMLLDWMTAIH